MYSWLVSSRPLPFPDALYNKSKQEDFNDLYWNSGDGGPQEDRTGASQNLNNLLGSMMRISMPSFDGYESSTGLPYAIPTGNYQGM